MPENTAITSRIVMNFSIFSYVSADTIFILTPTTSR